ncbi:hypothetical protein PsW64_05285 [Pseudovibrio sp. W64]|uniref:hypothetical protein n=1 Tax=Pseudovibrio sp. W64 TaxID=1735583 RepID=UPI0007AEA3EA|nr:hypothetical protein [Pseudovibrio sp. W64]KZK75381.1 hypothetical protein PsW64_05285 [Pseudovibrio sp. W64]
MEIKPGCIVFLKSSQNHPMTVSTIEDGHVFVVWQDNNKKMVMEKYPLTVLIHEDDLDDPVMPVIG